MGLIEPVQLDEKLGGKGRRLRIERIKTSRNKKMLQCVFSASGLVGDHPRAVMKTGRIWRDVAGNTILLVSILQKLLNLRRPNLRPSLERKESKHLAV